MYSSRPEDERLHFGDVLSAGWLFDLYLRHDAVALTSQPKGTGRIWYENLSPPRDREPGKDGVLSHADEALGSGNPRTAIVLTDDCEIQTLQERNASGRILLAGIQPATPAEIEAAQKLSTYRRFPLPADPESGFSGGIVELQRIFSVFLPSMLSAFQTRNREDADPTELRRLVGLDPVTQGRLSQSVCAHVTRHGPVVAMRESAKLAKLMTANGDPALVAELKNKNGTMEPAVEHKAVAEALTRSLAEAWVLEGRILDEVSEAWERGDSPNESVERIRDHLNRVRSAIDDTLERIDGAAQAN